MRKPTTRLPQVAYPAANTAGYDPAQRPADPAARALRHAAAPRHTLGNRPCHRHGRTAI